MTPAEEQILRNQVVIMGMLNELFDMPTTKSKLGALERGLNCLKETNLLLRTECQLGRTVYAYTP